MKNFHKFLLYFNLFKWFNALEIYRDGAAHIELTWEKENQIQEIAWNSCNCGK